MAEDRLSITYKSEPKELFMSFLRLNTCLRIVGDPSGLATMLIDPDMGENIIRCALSEKGGAGEMFSVELEDGDISMKDYDAILMWTQEHLASFFLLRLAQVQKVQSQLEPLVQAALKSPSPGSES